MTTPHTNPTPPAEPTDPPSPTEPDTSHLAYLAFWQERHLCTLTTLRPDGSPHVVPVGVTYEPEARLARVITRAGSAKVRHIREAGPEGARVAVCQVNGGRWATLEGRAFVRTDPDRVAEAERRYAERYQRVPSPNPARVVIEIEVTRTLGRA
ncbi:TIGR03618 family F420-dependent PPOX class oxidoreductase [Streptomyces sp. NPDC046862]|uniref:pyridoxamine 5'-phosphate oxidase family protein n=1 Tax=Streptomyces sp. NPDC046862 TaxID=3154603 RepID=UPI0034550BB1